MFQLYQSTQDINLNNRNSWLWLNLLNKKLKGSIESDILLNKPNLNNMKHQTLPQKVAQ